MLKKLGRRMRKGISTLIASVLLIAFTVAVAGIVSVWMTSFTRSSTGNIKSQADLKIICSNSGVSLQNVKYCSGYLSGDVSNSGTVALGNITLQILYSNGTMEPELYLSFTGSSVSTSTSCCGNLAISPGEKYRFNTTIDSNYNVVRVSTNCTETGTDEVSTNNGDISVTC